VESGKDLPWSENVIFVRTKIMGLRVKYSNKVLFRCEHCRAKPQNHFCFEAVMVTQNHKEILLSAHWKVWQTLPEIVGECWALQLTVNTFLAKKSQISLHFEVGYVISRMRWDDWNADVDESLLTEGNLYWM